VTSGNDVFAVPPSWAATGEIFYTADGLVMKHQVGGGHAEVAFTATVPVTARRPRPKSPDLESTKRRPVLGIAGPTVSPDGRWVAFRALNALWLAATSGRGQPRKLVADGYFNSDPDFSPDGRKLLYASDRDGTADLWLHDLATGADSSERRGR
jgi:Tol biopolymer transport system component